MSTIEGTEHLNPIAENMDDAYISQRTQILNEMASNKQNEQKIKEFMEQQQKIITDKNKLSHEKELINNEIKEKLQSEMKDRNELVNLLTTSNTLMTNNIDNLNLFGNVMQSCIDDHHKVDELKKDVADLFDKLKHKKYAEERERIEKLNFVKDYYNKCKENHVKNIENCCTMENEHLQKINLQRQIIETNKHKISILNENDYKVNQEIENIQNETTDLLNKLPELEKTFQEIMNEQDTQRNENKQKLLELETILSEKTENHTKKEIEIANFKDGLNCKTEYIKSLENIKEKKSETVSKLKENILEIDQKIQHSNNEFEKETENHNKEIENMTQETKKIQEKINNIETIYKNNVLQLETLENEQLELNNKLKTTETNTLNTKKEFDHLQELLEEQFLKFGAEIATLEKNLNEEITKENREEKNLEKVLEEMKKQHEEFTLRGEAKMAELEVESIEIEMTTNLMKDEIKEIKNKIEDVYNEISKRKHEIKMKQDKLEHDYENKMKNLSSYFEKLKIKLSNLHQDDLNKKNEELKKIKETEKTLELQVSELTVSTQILQNEVDLKIKELKEMNQKLNNGQKEEKETLKRSHVDFKIPKTKIPPSKYSSTSDDSMDERAMIKRRKINFKRRPDKKSASQKSTDQQNTKKSIENILDSINSGPAKRSTRKRTIKKPVF